MRPESGQSARRNTAGKSLTQRFFRHRADDQLPLTITHERIYILPSRRGWWFVASLLVMLVASINYSLSLGYALCFLLTGLFTATLLATYRNLSGLTIVNAGADEVHAGETQHWHVSIAANTARFGLDLSACDVTTRCNISATLPHGAAPHQPVRVEHRIVTQHRGWQRLGRVTLSSDYPLGLWYTWCYLHSPDSALVLPALQHDPDPWPNQSADTAGPEPVHEHTAASAATLAPGGETVGLRPYRDGDSVASIAWKNAARGQGLHVRETAAPNASANIELDWAMTVHAGDSEARLSLLASWIHTANKRQLHWSLTLPGVALPLAGGRQHRSASMRALALYDSRPPASGTEQGEAHG